MKWTEERRKIIADRIAELMREAGLLWLVFSLLDKLVSGQLSIPWVSVNITIAFVLIGAGTWIELREKTCPTNTSLS